MKRKLPFYCRHFEQCKCPTCNNVILSTPSQFLYKYVEANPTLVEIGTGICCWCDQLVIFVIPANLDEPVSAVRVHDAEEADPNLAVTRFIIKEPGMCPQVHGITDVIIKVIDGLYNARMGIAIMGSANFDSSAGSNPWDGNFHDNMVCGTGRTVEEAVEELGKDCESISRSIIG